MDDFQLAQININTLAEQSSGFIWRLQSEAGNATDVPYNDDPSSASA